MKRKLIKQGMGGYTITLPIKWVRTQGIDTSKEVDVEETQQGILITGKPSKKETKTDIDLSPFNERMTLNVLNQLYRVGYDTISIKYKNKEQYEYIHHVTRDVLLGFEIIQKKQDSCELQNIVEPEEEKFEVILRRIFFLIKELSVFISGHLAQEKYVVAEIESSKVQIDKLTNYARRTIIRAKKGGERTVLFYGVITQLSLIAHAYYYLYKYCCVKKAKIAKDILALLDECNTLYDAFYDGFYKKNFLLLNEIGEQKNVFFKKTDALLEKTKGHTNVILYYLRELMRLIQMTVPPAIGTVI